MRSFLRKAAMTGLCTGLVFVAAPVHAEYTAEQGRAIAAAIDSCKPGEFDTEHPVMPGFMIKHEIVGMQNGRCVYTQSMPNNMKMICSLTSAGRADAARLMRETAESGHYSGGMSNIPAFAKDCEVEMPNGYRVQMGQMPGMR